MCTCDNGKITCVSVPCPETRCDVLWSWYSERVSFSAKQCDPSIVDVLQCTNLVSSSLPCGCVTYVQDADELDAWRDEWEQLDCNSPTPCVPCPPPPRGAFCSREGTCLDVY
jgi:hypothetical protein